MEIEYRFTPDELRKELRLIGETYRLGSKPTETIKGKRLYAQMIPSELENEAEYIIKKAKYEYSNGLKEDMALTSKQLIALRKLVDYCMAL